MRPARPGVVAALLCAAGAIAPAARADEPQDKPLDPSRYVDPSYDPNAHGGLPYGTFLRISRGTARRSTGMMAAGISFTSGGLVLLGVGTAVYATKHCGDNFIFPGDGAPIAAPCPSHAQEVSGFAIMLTGALAAALGIPLWVVGAEQVPWAEASGANHRAAPAWARAIPAVGPAAAGSGVSLRWQF